MAEILYQQGFHDPERTLGSLIKPQLGFSSKGKAGTLAAAKQKKANREKESKQPESEKQATEEDRASDRVNQIASNRK